MDAQPSVMESVLRKLEFSEILSRLAQRCRFGVAAERALELGPSADVETVTYLLKVTAEAVDLLTNFPDINIGGPRDIREMVERAEKGGRLQPHELLLVLDTVHAARELRRSFVRLPDVEPRFPSMLEFVEHLADLPDLETDIGRSIGPRGDVLDTASPDLAKIRREVRIAHSRLMDRVNSLIAGGRYATALQDSLVTMRDGRYVIPVRSESRGQVQGVVHDTSSSGQTLFIEPLEIVELNNKWREHQVAEQHEIDRILDGLSAKVGSRADELETTVEAIAAIDLAMAKARLAFDMRATRPHVWNGNQAGPTGHRTHRIRLVRARHPLLDPATVVPITLELGEGFRVLLITGPNTGGKTVALKTVGLLSLMAQTGLFLPADDTSIVSVFPAVFADIGDEQSIAQSLSTFSAHMRTVIGMLGHVTEDSLVLLDELGAGTDPSEGSALARALISHLLERGPLVIATTHYSEVKAYAYATPAVENASVEFDLATLAPTYRLSIGVPGRSNALAIARRLGMPGEIVAEANTLLDPNELRVEEVLQDIRTRREAVDAALVRANATEEEAKQLRRLSARALREAEQERQGARADALAEAEAELTQVREALRKLQRDREMIAVTREHVEQRRQEVDQAVESVRTFKRERVRRAAPLGAAAGRAIKPGDRVTVVSLGQEAEVVAVEDGVAEVQMGSLKLRQPLEALTRLGRVQPPAQEERVYRPPTEFVPMEIDIRGHRAAEVPDLIEGYLESAYQSGLPWVRIIHGKGTGALREVVREHLRGHPAVSSSELAPREQGGDGATVARLKEQ